MANEQALVPIEQKTVDFYEDQVTAVRLASGDVFIPLRPIVDGLGIDWASQTRRINRDPILTEESKVCVVVTTAQGLPDQRRNMLCLPLKHISGFLFGVNSSNG